MRSYFYLGDNRGLTQLSTGELFFVNTEDRSIAPWIIYSGYWEIFVDDILCALARPGDTFIDVGANMGYYTVKIGAKVGPEGRVYSFEPNPHVFAFLADNVKINNFQARTHLFQMAAGAEQGEVWLGFSHAEPGGGAVWEQPLGVENEMPVPVARLDDIATMPVDLIKIDVEGFEPQALKGMRAMLERSPDAAVVLELVFAHWQRFGDPLEILRAAAGQREVYLIHQEGWIERLRWENAAAVLDVNFARYLLLLPPTAERRAQIQPFVERDRSDTRPISLRLSRGQRLRRRLIDWFNGR
jgi:FkbM family methyltransferase